MVWLALAASLVLVVATLAFAALRGLAAFRAVKGLGRSVDREIERIAAASAQIEWHLTEAAEAGTRLERSLARLRASNARLDVLRSALADVQAAVGRVTAVYPRK